MPIQRTREQKIKAQARRAEMQSGGNGPSYTFTATVEGNTVAVGKELVPDLQMTYIRKDLFRTVLVSAVLFAALVGIYIYLGYN